VIAQGIINAAKTVHLSVPLVVRLEGTNVEAGKKLLADSGLAVITADDLGDAAEKAVKAAGQSK
jgi:succinyl-CoA synthetase beta subunit